MLFRGGTKRFSILFVVGFLLIAFYATLQHQRTGKVSSADAADGRKTLFYRDAYLSAASNSTIAAYLRSLTLHPHLAGTPLSLSTATYVQSHFQSLGLTTHMTNFSALLSYPKTSSLTARFTNGTALPITSAEPGVPQNGVVMPYHAYAHSGSANGPAVLLNYGREQDYRALRALGVEVKGCVGLVRRGSDMSRYEIVTKAAAHGVSGVLMYTESQFKEGVERGTIMNGLGDPLSPGWPGINGGEKLELKDRSVTQKFPGVPSLPVSQAAAEGILGLLEGPELPIDWAQSLTSGGGHVGPGPIILNLSYEGERKMAAVHNVFAVIKGSEEPDRTVLLGNHRDAWTYGAVDPNSGTAALLDIARRFALLLSLGWNPRRNIVLCSWDAEEFGMIGSTEWVEQNALNLGSKAVAYLNVDCAVQGPGFFVSATPQLDDLIVEVTKKVKDPDTENIYLHESWVASNRPGSLVDRLGRVDSDFAPFLHHAGVPSVDFYFGIDFSVYHTAFDSYDWMVKYGDPSFQRHVTVAGIWGLVALHLADDAILPFNYLSYATELQDYTNTLKPLLDERISLEPLESAIKEFISAVDETEQQLKKLKPDESHDGATILRRRALNDRLMLAEKGFLDMEGLPQDQWFKHLIYGPVGGDNHIKISFFPGVAYAMTERRVDEKQRARVQHEIWRVARAIQRSASALRGELT